MFVNAPQKTAQILMLYRVDDKAVNKAMEIGLVQLERVKSTQVIAFLF